MSDATDPILPAATPVPLKDVEVLPSHETAVLSGVIVSVRSTAAEAVPAAASESRAAARMDMRIFRIMVSRTLATAISCGPARFYTHV